MKTSSPFLQPSFAKDFAPRNVFGMPPEQFTGIVHIATFVMAMPVYLAQDPDNFIYTDAAQGTDYYIDLSDNATIVAPTNPFASKIIRYWIEQPNKGARITWDAIFHWCDTYPEPTLSEKEDYTDLIEFSYNPVYAVWDCIRICLAYQQPPAP